jgi:hypothetical protein
MRAGWNPRREPISIGVPQCDHLPPTRVEGYLRVLDQNPPEETDGGQVTQPDRRGRIPHRSQQACLSRAKSQPNSTRFVFDAGIRASVIFGRMMVSKAC